MTNNPGPADPATYGKDLTGEDLVQLAVNTIRGLSMDAVQKANSGHPGMPMGMADCAAVLWLKHLEHDPQEPGWTARDRFVLSAGHGSMLLYSLLHLFGYGLSLDDLRNFRQWGSLTPGHPEYELTRGVETTTGPLGQGFANGVGMAVAERILAEMFASGEEFNPAEHYTYGIVSDGDLMEGIASEAASLAGHWGLGRLIYIYDDNHITIDGNTKLAFTEDVGARFKAYGWHVQSIAGHDRMAADRAIKKAKRVADRPSLIMARSHIGYGSPNKQDNADAHGSPLGEEEVVKSKQNLGFPVEPAFFVPDAVRELFAKRARTLKSHHRAWEKRFHQWRADHPDKAALWDKLRSEIPADLHNKFPEFKVGEKIATRQASGKTIQFLAGELPGLVGGSADLAPSNNTIIKDANTIGKYQFKGRNFHFGVREHAMGGIMNGIALHGGLIPYGGTFLVFSDYMRPSIRLASLMKQRVIYVFTHDSIFLGEDGPTHQPVEHLHALRNIPGVRVIRPGDATEVPWAWLAALKYQGPTALALSRQGLPVPDRSKLAPASELMKGGYIIKKERATKIDVLFMATGSEVHLALDAAAILEGDGLSVRVVNMPCISLFEEQPGEYKDEVLPPGALCRVAVEAGRSACWGHYVDPFGVTIGIDRFGRSAPQKALAEKFGFTPEQVAKAARECHKNLPERAVQYAANIKASLDGDANLH